MEIREAEDEILFKIYLRLLKLIRNEIKNAVTEALNEVNGAERKMPKSYLDMMEDE